MAGQEIARVDTQQQAMSLRASMDYAKALSCSNMLPAQYRGRPENVLWGMEYGRTLGLTPIAVFTGVHVIDGKPSASAGLISGLVRKAGHRLRVSVSYDEQRRPIATAEIVRSDDTEHTFRSVWTIARAEQACLVNKGTWKAYPEAMLKARAISEVARDACEEVLFGLHYTPEELGVDTDAEGEPLAAQRSAAPNMPDEVAEDVTDAEVVAEQDPAPATARSGLTYEQQAAVEELLDRVLAERDVNVLRATYREAPKATKDAIVHVDSEYARVLGIAEDGPLGRVMAAAGKYVAEHERSVDDAVLDPANNTPAAA